MYLCLGKSECVCVRVGGCACVFCVSEYAHECEETCLFHILILFYISIIWVCCICGLGTGWGFVWGEAYSEVVLRARIGSTAPVWRTSTRGSVTSDFWNSSKLCHHTAALTTKLSLNASTQVSGLNWNSYWVQNRISILTLRNWYMRILPKTCKTIKQVYDNIDHSPRDFLFVCLSVSLSYFKLRESWADEDAEYLEWCI